MPCPASGQISISDLVAEFGGTAPHSMSEYYRNGDLVPGNNTNVPESGQFSLTNCYSAVNEILHTHSDGDTHANLATIFGDNWASTVPKRVVVPSGVTVGGTSTHAMNVPSGMGGTLNIVVSGNIHGHGGAANGGNGGNAIHCVQTSGVTITLNSGGTIKAGGGGGGQGGTGGTGGNGGAGGQGGQGRYKVANTGWRYFANSCSTAYNCALQACNNQIGWGASAPPSNYAGSARNTSYYTGGYWDDIYRTQCESWSYTTGGAGGAGSTSGGAGGAGGAGGVGQGYNQSNASGSSGASGSAGGSGTSGSAGGNSAGTGGTGGSGGTGGQGGTGGTGGTFGNSGGSGTTGSSGNTGATGNTGANGNYGNGSSGSSGSSGASGSGGSSGGAAGYYIYNRASITFNNNGTVAGQ